MHYLKCNHCGYLNPVKSEFMVFCNSCGKKIHNNYKDWQKSNPRKTFSDYKELVCVSEEQMAEIREQQKPTKNGYILPVIIISLLLAIVILLFVSRISLRNLPKLILTEKTDNEVLEKKWLRANWGDQGLFLETPDSLTPVMLPLPPEVEKLIEEKSHFQYNKKGFKLFVNSFKYKPVIDSANLLNAGYGAIMKMKQQQGVTELNYDQEKIEINGIPGILQKGSYKMLGIENIFMNVIFVQKLNMWQITAVHQKEDKIGEIAAKRIIDSIEIKPEIE